MFGTWTTTLISHRLMMCQTAAWQTQPWSKPPKVIETAHTRIPWDIFRSAGDTTLMTAMPEQRLTTPVATTIASELEVARQEVFAKTCSICTWVDLARTQEESLALSDALGPKLWLSTWLTIWDAAKWLHSQLSTAWWDRVDGPMPLQMVEVPLGADKLVADAPETWTSWPAAAEKHHSISSDSV